MDLKYPVYTPSLKGNEKKYVNECLDTTWISSRGKFISSFEKAYSNYIGVEYASAVSNGTVALHLASLALGIGPGDEVILPTFTFVATANALLYIGATPVFVDSLRDTWQADPADIERKITSKTKAIILVHLYGHACNMDAIIPICKRNNLLLIEDCAEAIGSLYKNKPIGSFGDIATFSFFGNKTITTGEGGMVLSNSKELIDKVNHYKSQCMTNTAYWHDLLGFNYRMTNICAAIGLAQLERIDEIINRKIGIADLYRKLFKNSKIEFHAFNKDVFHTYWMCSILLPSAEKRDLLRQYLYKNSIDSRPLFFPIHTMPYFQKYAKGEFPVVTDISTRGINLPSYPDLSDDDVIFIAQKVLEFVDNE
jgi:perosamine synthetase